MPRIVINPISAMERKKVYEEGCNWLTSRLGNWQDGAWIAYFEDSSIIFLVAEKFEKEAMEFKMRFY